MNNQGTSARFAALASLVVVAASLILVALRFAPMAGRDIDTAPEDFSAARAKEQLAVVLADERPHPVGSLANEAVRKRIVARLQALGYAPELQSQVVCNRRGICARVRNVIATTGGGHDAILLAVHYDSVPAGPGASDDGSGVAAALEIARAVKAGGATMPRPLMLLFSDGEEGGLLGAKAFMSHPWSKRVKLAINLEARGRGGPSLMFETSGATAPLIEMLADSVERPLTSSLFDAVYQRLPNDTDFSIFKRHGIPGYNFAFIGGVSSYHTDRDDMAHLSVPSLQHQGQSALALIRAEAQHSPQHLSGGGQVVWFDLLGLGIVRWPVDWSLPMALLLALAMVALWWALARQHGASFKQVALSSSAQLVVLMGAGGVGYGLLSIVQGRRGAVLPRFTQLEPLAFAALVLALALIVFATRWLAPRTTLISRYLGSWLLWSWLGVLVARLFPAASHLFIAPTCVALLCGLAALRGLEPKKVLLLTLLPSLMAMCMWFRLAIGLGWAGGLMAYPAVAVVLALPMASVLPALAVWRPRRKAMLSAGVGFVATSALAVAWPEYTAEEPQRLSLVHAQGHGIDGAQWWIDASWGDMPAKLAEAAKTERYAPSPLPVVAHRRVAVAVAEPIEASEVAVERLAGVAGVAGEALEGSAGISGGVQLRIVAASDVDAMLLLLPPQSDGLTLAIAGQTSHPITLSKGPFKGHRMISYLGALSEPLLVELSGEMAPDAALTTVAVRYGLGAGGKRLQAARGETGVPSQHGDMSLRFSRVSLDRFLLKTAP